VPIATKIIKSKHCIYSLTGIIIVSYLTDFSSEKYIPKVAGQGQNRSKMEVLKRGCRWFQLLFIDFQSFYFLARIIPVHVYMEP
jgi:hypothetical protein